MTTTATILVQTAEPARTADVAQALAELGRATQVAGPYDVLLEVDALNPDALGRIVVAVQAVDHVDRTLTLPHVPQE